MDNESIIKIMQDTMNCDEGACTFIMDCKRLVASWRSISVRHICREGNKSADYLANLGQQGEWGMVHLDDPLDGLIDLLQADAGGASTCRV